MVYFGIVEFFGGGNAEYFLAFGSVQKFALFIQQFLRIPLLGIV